MRRTASIRFVDSTRGAGRRAARPAFTLVELLVVIGIIIVLLSLVVGISVRAVENAKQADTRAMFSILDMAVDQFKEETRGTLGRVQPFVKRCGGYPPDELQFFADPTSGGGIPGSSPPRALVNDHYIEIATIGGLDRLLPTSTVAMALAIRLYSEEAAVTLERVDPRFRKVVNTGQYYWERDGDTGFTPESEASIDAGDTSVDTDEAFDYYVDAWGAPIEYFSAREPMSDEDEYSRAALSTRLTGLANGRPVFVSYGPNGPDQRSGTLSGAQNMFDDWAADAAINDPLNQDNVYSVPDLGAKLAR